MSNTDEVAAIRPAWATVAGLRVITGLSRRILYDLMGAGHIRARKRGATTLGSVDDALTYIENLPPAKIAPPKPRTAKVGGPQHQAENAS